MTNAVTILNAPNATNELHSITVNCTIHPNSTADQCVVMAIADGRVTRTGMYIILNTTSYTYCEHVATCMYITCTYVIQSKC